MQHEWEKHEIVRIPEFKFYTIKGKGNPNDDFFPEYIAVLYSLSYAIKMSPKQGMAPKNYFEYTVDPLEGVWDIDEDAKEQYDGTLDKNLLVFNLMMRQPDFVTSDHANEMLERTKKKKPHDLLDKVEFTIIDEGLCVQMLHKGSYDNEPESFRRMELFSQEQNLKRISHIHREIYLSDARKVAPERLRTVLRFQVK